MDARPSLGRFSIRSRIGTGGMGEVYLAAAPGPRGVEKLVAVKLIRGLQEREAGLLEMFIEEAKVSFLLSHANIVQTYEIGEIDGHYFLVMEYVDGSTLSQLLSHFREKLRQPMPTPFALYVAGQVARGLDHAHTLTDGSGRPLGIVHRDVSPSNVLISKDGQVKVSDFGLATSVLREYESQSGEVKGKAAYMAPEQLAARRVDARADIFALGVVLYEMLSGRSPFAERVRDVSIASRLRGAAPTPFVEVAPHAHPSVVSIVERCIAVDSAARFASAGELGRALDGCLRALGQPVSSYEFADFVAEARKVAQAAPVVAHPFDRALGMVIQKVEANGAVERYITLPPEAAPLPAGPPPPAGTLDRTLPPASAEDAAPAADAARAPTLPDLSSVVGPREPASQVSQVAGEASTSLPVVSGSRRWLSAAAILVAVSGAIFIALGLNRSVPAPAGTAARPVATAGPDATPPRLARRAPDAGRVAAPLPPDARARGLRRAPAAARAPAPFPRATGYLSVNSEPWSNVSVDGGFVQSTPVVRHRLAVGKHRVTLLNPARSLRAERQVTIKADQVTELIVELAR